MHNEIMHAQHLHNEGMHSEMMRAQHLHEAGTHNCIVHAQHHDAHTQARERMVQELQHDEAQRAAAAATAAQAARPIKAHGNSSDSGSGTESEPDDVRTRIIDAVIGPALSAQQQLAGGPKDAELESEERARKQQLEQRVRELEAREARLAQSRAEQEAAQVRELEEEQQRLREELGPLMQAQVQGGQQQQGADSNLQRAAAGGAGGPAGLEGRDVLGGLPEYENLLDSLFDSADEPGSQAAPAPMVSQAPQQEEWAHQQAPQQPDAVGTPAAPAAELENAAGRSFLEHADIFGGLPDFENPLDELLKGVADEAGGDAGTGAVQQQQQQQEQEQRLRLEKQAEQLSEQGLSILELIQRGVQQDAPAEELKQLINAAYAVEAQQPQAQATAPPPAGPPQPLPQQHLQPQQRQARPEAPSQGSNVSVAQGSGSSTNASCSSNLGRVGRTGRGSIFNRGRTGSSSSAADAVDTGASPSLNTSSSASTSASASTSSRAGDPGRSSSGRSSASTSTSTSSGAGDPANPASRLSRSWNKGEALLQLLWPEHAIPQLS